MSLERIRRYWLKLKKLGISGIFKEVFGYLVNALINNISVPFQAYVFGISIFSALCIIAHYGLVPTNIVIDGVNTYLSAANFPGVLPTVFLISVLVLMVKNLRYFSYIEDEKTKRRKAFSATMIQSIILIFGLLGALAGFALKAFPEAITNHLLFVGLSSSMLSIGLIKDRLARWIVQFY